MRGEKDSLTQLPRKIGRSKPPPYYGGELERSAKRPTTEGLPNCHGEKGHVFHLARLQEPAGITHQALKRGLGEGKVMVAIALSPCAKQDDQYRGTAAQNVGRKPWSRSDLSAIEDRFRPDPLLCCVARFKALPWARNNITYLP